MDAIAGFAAGAGTDVVEFGGNMFADFASLMAAATQSGADVVIAYDAENTLTLQNVALSTLQQDDFRFAA